MSIKSIPLYLFSIVIDLPKTNAKTGKPDTDANGEVIYQINYFCGIERDKSGASFNVWDTDKKFCARFVSHTMAENFRRVVLENLEGTRVIEMKPLQNREKFFGKNINESHFSKEFLNQLN